MAVPLLVLVGIPGSGKSTWANDRVASGRYHLVSTDAIRAELYGSEACQGDWRQIWQRVLVQWHQGVAAIYRGDLEGVIYDATNARRRHRREAIAAARAAGFDTITLVWFDIPLDSGASTQSIAIAAGPRSRHGHYASPDPGGAPQFA
jgi:predicted kinase